MKKILVLLGCILFIMPSCKKSFELTPTDFMGPENYFENEEQLNYALNGVYSTFALSGLYASNMLGRLGLDADQGYDRYSHDEASVSDYNYTSADTKILAYWRALYQGINRANLVLENIDKPVMEEAKRDKVRGQALFLRAYFYSLLVTRFGDVPLVLNTVSSASSEALQIARTPAKEVYEKILADMEEASELVDDITVTGAGGRVSKSAVWGIMARVCLYMAGNPVNDETKYEEAKKWAEKVVTSGKHSLNPSFQDLFIRYARDEYDNDYRESIWEVEFWGNGTGIYTNLGGYVGRNNGIGSTEDPNIGYSAGMVRTTTVQYKLYSANDLRRDWSIAPFRYVGDDPAVATNWSSTQIVERYCGKWRREYEIVLPRSTTRTNQNFPLLRYSDVLLMLAEAENKLNGPDDAYDYINQVRRRAFGKPVNIPDPTVDLEDLDEASFFEQLQNERSRELAFECLRKDDLIRWNIFASSMKYALNDLSTTNTAAGIDAKRTFTNASARDALWPIPLFELGVNKKLVQNPGW